MWFLVGELLVYRLVLFCDVIMFCLVRKSLHQKKLHEPEVAQFLETGSSRLWRPQRRMRKSIHVGPVMACFEAVSFSPNGNYLAATSFDGRLRIWETPTGVLKQEYTPSSHLSATCSCLSWGFAKDNAASVRKKKKRRSEVVQSAEELNLLAMGTSSGSILLYSISKGDLQSQMTGGHSSKVTSICWSSQNGSIYSGSKDSQIVEWDVATGEVKRKWNADQGKYVHAMCVSDDGRTLITASRKIQWWDLETLQIVKTFTGHATPVRQVMFACYLNSSDTDGRYLLSCAVGDKVINAWQLNKESNHNALAAFSLSDEPLAMDVSIPASRDQTILLAVTTKGGVLHIFEHHLNGRCKKPLQPAVKITVTSEGFEDDEGVAQILPIASTRFCDDAQRSILFTYGDVMQLRFEKVPYSSKEKEVCLIRNKSSKASKSEAKNSTKIKTPKMNPGVKILTPSNLTVASTSKPPRKKERLSINELPMEERLNILELKQSVLEPPKATSHPHLLLQALQSNDSDMLKEIFKTHKEKTIRKTVERLPVQSIVTLIKELQKRVCSNAPNSVLIKWLRCVFLMHTSYLMTLPNLDKLLGPLHQAFMSRMQMFDKISKLYGRIDLVQTQLFSANGEKSNEPPKEAFLEYQADYSSDEAEETVYMPSHSETEEDWNPSSGSDADDGMEIGENGRSRNRINSSDEMSDME